MATKVLLLFGAATTHRGAGTSTKLDGASTGWQCVLADTSQGASSQEVSVSTVTGPTNGVEFVGSINTLEWISEPVDQDVTISGTITANLWARESSMNANAAINFVVDVIRATDNSIVQIVKSARTTELGTSDAAANFTASPTSTVVNKGDRLRIRPFIDDATSNMASGFTCTLSYNGAAGVDGDSYISFNETFGFMGFASGTAVHLTDTVSGASTSDTDLEAWTSVGSGATTAGNAAYVDGPTAGVQAKDAFDNPVSWFTRPLQATTLSGRVSAFIKASQSSAIGNGSLRVEIARVDGDGSNATVWGSWCINPASSTGSNQGELGTTEDEVVAYISGDDLAISDGQRIRLRMIFDDCSNSVQVSSPTGKIHYNGTTEFGTSDSYIRFVQTLTEFVSGPPTRIWPARTLVHADAVKRSRW